MGNLRLPAMLLIAGLVVGGLYVTNHPESIRTLSSTPAAGTTQTVKVLATYNPTRHVFTLRDPNGSSRQAYDREVFESSGRGIPDKSAGYLHFIASAPARDTLDRQYNYRLGKGVKDVRLVSPPSFGATLTPVENAASVTPRQYEIWLSRDMEIDLEIQVEIPEAMVVAEAAPAK